VRILLIRLRLIGDVVFTTPLIGALRRRYPHARLEYLVEPQAAPVVANSPHLDELLVATAPRARGRLLADLALARELRRRRYDVVIDLHGGPRSALLTLATRAPRRIGYQIPGRRWVYTDRVPRARELRPRHSVVNQWDLLAPLGFGPPGAEDDVTEMACPPPVSQAVLTRLRAAGVDPAQHAVVLIHVSAGNPFRRWPPESFVALVTRLARADSRRRLLLLSGPSEATAAREIGDRARAELGPLASSVVNGVELDLGELRAALDHAVLFVGGDSGPLHVAGTTGVPIVGLYGPTLPARSAPWRPARFVTKSVEVDGLPCRPCDQRRCEPGDFRCLGWIEPEAVAAAAEKAIAASGRWTAVDG
jgi:lipopolysaccharide heptosyltransferase II